MPALPARRATRPHLGLMKQCPTCSKPVKWPDNPYRPFCSERCKLIDLGKWVSEEYRVPGKPIPTADNDTQDAERDGDRERT
jgi:endogenous inhibitor of DNA gyrase (YacG/DUF329 family)